LCQNCGKNIFSATGFGVLDGLLLFIFAISLPRLFVANGLIWIVFFVISLIAFLLLVWVQLSRPLMLE